MAERLVVIGGDAGGMAAASQARRQQPYMEIVALERGRWTSYSACGIPYLVAGDVASPPGPGGAHARGVPRQPAHRRAHGPRGDRRSTSTPARSRCATTAATAPAARVRPAAHRHRRPPDPARPARHRQPVRARRADPRRRRPPARARRARPVRVRRRRGRRLHRARDGRGVPPTGHAGHAHRGRRPADAHHGPGHGRAGRRPRCASSASTSGSAPGRSAFGDGAVETDAGPVPGRPRRARPRRRRRTPALAADAGVDARRAGRHPGRPPPADVRPGRVRRRRLRRELPPASPSARSTSPSARWPTSRAGSPASTSAAATPPSPASSAPPSPSVCAIEVARTGVSEQEADRAGFEYESVKIDSTTRAGYFPGTKPIAIKLLAERGTAPDHRRPDRRRGGRSQAHRRARHGHHGGHDRRRRDRPRPGLRPAVLRASGTPCTSPPARRAEALDAAVAARHADGRAEPATGAPVTQSRALSSRPTGR